jgi:hypothetical protein
MDGYHVDERRNTASKGSTLLVVLGWVCALISLAYLPFVFGMIGVIMGILASKGGSKAGVAVIAGNIVLMAIGLMFSGVILNNLRHLLGI